MAKTLVGKKIVLLTVSLLVILFFVRTYRLDIIPVYLDEGIYINWAYMFSQNKDFAYFSMQDGKTPLYFWTTSFFLSKFNDPLLAARFVSAIAGFGMALIGFFSLKKLFGLRTALFFLFLEILVPYALFLERMAFADSFFVFWGMSAFFLSLLFFYSEKGNKNTILSVFLGIINGFLVFLSFLSKSTGKIYLWLIFLLAAGKIFEKRKKLNHLIPLFIFLIFTFLTYREWQNAFRTGSSRFFLNISSKEKLLSVSPTEIIKNPLLHLNLQNFGTIASYFKTYLSLPFLFFLVFGLINALKRKQSKEIIIFLCFIFLSLGIYFSSRIPSSRYFLPVVPLAIIMASIEINHLLGKKLFSTRKITKTIELALFAIAICFWVNFEINYLFNRSHKVLSPQDIHYFFESDLSGIGIKETIDYTNQLLNSNDVTLAVDQCWGQTDYLNAKLALSPQKNKYKFELKKCFKPSKEVLDGLVKETKTHKVLILTLASQIDYSILNENPHIKKVMDIPRLPMKNGQINHVFLYQVNPAPKVQKDHSSPD